MAVKHAATHAVIRASLHRSPLFSGAIDARVQASDVIRQVCLALVGVQIEHRTIAAHAPLSLAGVKAVLLRAVSGAVDRIRAFSEDCELDAGGLTGQRWTLFPGFARLAEDEPDGPGENNEAALYVQDEISSGGRWTAPCASSWSAPASRRSRRRAA